MPRLSEEQRGILSCYSGSRKEVIARLRMAIPFIEDIELREISIEQLTLMEKLDDEEFEVYRRNREMVNNERVN